MSRDSAGTVGFYKAGGSTYGTINVGNMVIDNPTSSNVNLVVKGAAAQSANLQEWQNSAGTVGARVGSDSNIDTTGIVAASGGMTSHGLIQVKVGGNDQWLNNFSKLPGYGMGVNVGAEQYFVINNQINSVVGLSLIHI